MSMTDYMRVEIILDRPLLENVTRIAREAGVSGHTVLPALSGEGVSGGWTEDLVTRAQSKVVFMAITSDSKARAFLDALKPLLDSHGLVALGSPAVVIRGAKFD